MYCPKCGNLNDEGAVYCKYCGAPMSGDNTISFEKLNMSNSPVNQLKSEANRANTFGILSIVFGALGSILCLIFAIMNANTTTATMMMMSIMISNVFAVVNSWKIPIAHIIISTIGSRYLITKLHVLPTLKVEVSFNAGMKCSTP